MENLILSHLVAPGDGQLSRRAAEGLLAIRFHSQDVERMNALAAVASTRPLTLDERREMETYDRIGRFLALIHSKARIALEATPGAAGG